MVAWFRGLAILTIVSASGDLHAGLGDLFRRNKVDPTEQVPAFLKILKTDRDEDERVKAAEELRNYDPKAFVDIFPGLIEALQNDPSAAVRIEAINSIAKLRPVNSQAGYALEQATAHDSTAKVRAAAKTVLGHYAVMGYRTNKPQDARAIQSNEPPLAPATSPSIGVVANPKVKPPTAETVSNRVPPVAPLPALPPSTATAAKVEPSRGFLPRLFGKPEPAPTTAPTKVVPAALTLGIAPRSTLNQSMEPPLANPLGTAPVPAERNGAKRSILPAIPASGVDPVATPSPFVAPLPTIPELPARPVTSDSTAADGPILGPRK